MPYHGFGTKVYTLAIGPERQKLSVQEHIITQIPHFRKALMDGDLEQEIHYIMEKDDPEAVATVLAFVRDGALPELDTKNQKPHTMPSVNDQIEDCVKAYIVALEWGLEAAQNAIIDKTCPLLQRQQKHNKLKVRFDASVQPESFFYSQMYRLLCGQIAYQMQQDIQQRPDDSLRSEALVLNETMQNSNWNWDFLFSLTTHLLRPSGESPLDVMINYPCMHHVHTSTVRCPTDDHGQLATTSSSSAGVLNPTEALKVKIEEKKEAKKQLSWRSKYISLTQPQTQSDNPPIEAKPSLLQMMRPSPSEQYAPGRPTDSVFDMFGGSKLDRNNTNSSKTGVNKLNTMEMSQEACDSPRRKTSSEMTPASTAMLTPTSSAGSAASQSTIHTVSARDLRAPEIFNPRRCPCSICGGFEAGW